LILEHVSSVPDCPGSRPDFWYWRIRKSLVEHLNDIRVVAMTLKYDEVLQFQHDTQSIRGVDMQQLCLVHLQGHADVGQHAVQ
jgi:hypothetical protein